MKLATTALLAALVSTSAYAQPNLGAQKPEASLPFTMTQVTTLNSPWRIAFLPDGRMVITEKGGTIQVVTQDGKKTPVDNVPKVVFKGQGGLLGVYGADLRQGPRGLSDLFRAPGCGWLQPCPGAGQADPRRRQGEPGRPEGDLARRRGRRRRPVRRRGGLCA